ncbi:cellulose biosynthesis protein BcsR [Sodalis sp. C49]|uniref:cellulose biosynthesis protein BcsR n=1 Tax=unclassified Sodalis (in: enterobacteria) TaxID=2636512 RepID=UPI003965C709
MKLDSIDPGAAAHDESDDFAVLSHLFSLPELNYVDITRAEKIPLMMSRWPLLAELAGVAYDASQAEAS